MGGKSQKARKAPEKGQSGQPRRYLPTVMLDDSSSFKSLCYLSVCLLSGQYPEKDMKASLGSGGGKRSRNSFS